MTIGPRKSTWRDPQTSVNRECCSYKSFKLNNPWIEATFHTCCKLISEYKDPFLPIIWITYDPKFMPNATDGKQWVNRGRLMYDNGQKGKN